jgi:hypothetical protein
MHCTKQILSLSQFANARTTPTVALGHVRYDGTASFKIDLPRVFARHAGGRAKFIWYPWLNESSPHVDFFLWIRARHVPERTGSDETENWRFSFELMDAKTGGIIGVWLPCAYEYGLSGRGRLPCRQLSKIPQGDGVTEKRDSRYRRDVGNDEGDSASLRKQQNFMDVRRGSRNTGNGCSVPIGKLRSSACVSNRSITKTI